MTEREEKELEQRLAEAARNRQWRQDLERESREDEKRPTAQATAYEKRYGPRTERKAV